MNAEQLRKLADKLHAIAGSLDFASCGYCLASAAYLREQADRQERGAVGYFIEGADGTWDQADAAFAADPDVVPLYLHPAPQSVPAGWKLVPLEPERAQWEAGAAHVIRLECDDGDARYTAIGCAVAIYKDMLAASPAAPDERPQSVPEGLREAAQRALAVIETLTDAVGHAANVALDDFMDQQSIDDLIDFVCDQYAAPAAPAPADARGCQRCGGVAGLSMPSCTDADCGAALTNKPTAPADAVEALQPAARDVLIERQRQVEAEGWTPEHDDSHEDGALAHAAACYAADSNLIQWYSGGAVWPWGWQWKPSDDRRRLVKAGALILAEIERLDRAALAAADKGAK